MLDFSVDLAANVTKNCLSYLDNPPDPSRVCQCGYQADGSKIDECLACRRWRKAQRSTDLKAPIGIPDDIESQFATAQADLREALDAQSALLAKQACLLGLDATTKRAQRKQKAQDVMRAELRVNKYAKMLAVMAVNSVDMQGVA
jgi:hypothetical protein